MTYFLSIALPALLITIVMAIVVRLDLKRQAREMEIENQRVDAMAREAAQDDARRFRGRLEAGRPLRKAWPVFPQNRVFREGDE